MAGHWQLQLFGGLHGRCADHSFAHLGTRRAALLLGYLARSPGQFRPRELVADVFWPETTGDRARNSLSAALSALRRALAQVGAADWLEVNRDALALNATVVTTDVSQFEHALRDARSAASAEARRELLRRGVGLYRGEFMAGYYHDWVRTEQRSLADAFHTAVSTLVADAERDGDLHGALEYAWVGVRMQPLREEAHAELIRIQMAAGHEVDARCQYDELRRLLDRHLGTAPSPATLALLTGGGRPGLVWRDLQFRSSRFAARPAALPTPVDSFVGRGSEVRRLSRLLTAPRPRLISLVGPSGMGKTRLALECGAEVAGYFGGAVWFVPLGDCNAAGRVPAAVAGVVAGPDRALPVTVGFWEQWFNRGPSLLILDCLAHLLPEVAEFVRQWLAQAPALTCLVAAREALGLPGEYVWTVAPLPLPTGAESTHALRRFACVRLLVDRARAGRPEFQVTDANRETVVQLCLRLEGVPLALELAATNLRTFTPAELAAELIDRLDLLTDTGPGHPAHQRSLEAAVAWSLERLPPTLHDFFLKLSVFRGGFSVAGAAAVCEAPAAREWLAELCARGLLVAGDGDDGRRFRMLRLCREHTETRLPTPAGVALHRRHAAYFVELAQAAHRCYQGEGSEVPLATVTEEEANLWAALTWCLAHEPALALELTAALGWHWEFRGLWADGRQLLIAALAGAPATPTATRATALRWAGWLAHRQGDEAAAERLLTDSVAAAEAASAPEPTAAALLDLGYVVLARGDLETARAWFEASLPLWPAEGCRNGPGQVSRGLGDVALREGEAGTARQHYELALAQFRQDGGPRAIATGLGALGNLEFAEGNLTAAERLHEEALALGEQVDDRLLVALACEALGRLASRQQRYPAARDRLTRALGLMRDLGAARGVANALYFLAEVDTAAGDLAAARHALDECLTACREQAPALTARTLSQLAVVADRQGDPLAAARYRAEAVQAT